MEELYECVCGLDVHKKVVVACLRRIGDGGRVYKEIRKFSTMTRNLRALREWLKESAVTHVAMESTGVFWKPIHNLLEGEIAHVLLVNPQHMKQVTGRKTDVTDAEWIAQLLQCGLLRGSLVPPKQQREIRDLTRHRTKLTQQRAAVVNRIHKVLEDANIKLGSVASNILGMSGRDMLSAIVGGEEDPGALAELARRSLRAKIPELRAALEGNVTDHHRFQLEMLLTQLDFLGQQIEKVSLRIEEIGSPFFTPVRELFQSIPGAAQRSTENILAEIGTNMGAFPSAKHLASWGAVCPGNNKTAGKNKSGKTRKGNRWLRAALTQMAWAAVRTKDTYFRAQYQRLARRRGKQRAITAVSHSLLTTIYAVLTKATPYKDLGPDFLLHLHAERSATYYVRQLERLGHQVTLTPLAA